jgi:hypothetical protein
VHFDEIAHTASGRHNSSPRWTKLIMAEDDMKVFHYGESVIMAGEDRHFEGVVVAAFRERSSGKWRYVVEDNRGTQQTFSSAQLLRR